MQIFKFRVLLDGEDKIFRDIEMPENANSEQFHRTILNAFNFTGKEMASFFMSNSEWEKGVEIPLVDMGLAEAPLTPMADLELKKVAGEKGSRLIYVYDFLNLWIFFIELMDISKSDPKKKYPQIVAELGDAPREDSRDIAKELEVMQETGGSEIDSLAEEDEFENEEGFESLDDYQDMI